MNNSKKKKRLKTKWLCALFCKEKKLPVSKVKPGHLQRSSQLVQRKFISTFTDYDLCYYFIYWNVHSQRTLTIVLRTHCCCSAPSVSYVMWSNAKFRQIHLLLWYFIWHRGGWYRLLLRLANTPWEKVWKESLATPWLPIQVLSHLPYGNPVAVKHQRGFDSMMRSWSSPRCTNNHSWRLTRHA